MRLEIILKGKNNFKVPFNYNHILSAIIYNKIADLNFANELHSSKSFKFFTFSQIYIPKRRIVKDGIIAKDGVISFYISSPNDFLIKSLVDGFLEDLEISFQNQKLTIQKIEALKTPEFSSKSEFKTLAPIIVRTKKEIDGELKIWDLAPSDKFFKSLENNLIKNITIFKVYTRLTNKTNLKAGTYNFSEDMGVKKIVSLLEEGKTNENNITFKEGINVRGIAKLISKKTNNSYDSIITIMNDNNYIDELISKYWFLTNDIKNKNIYYTLEGYLFPDTYNVMKDTDIKDIITKMLDETDNKLSKYKDSITNNKLSIHEIITLASVVELEVANKDDRKSVAGIFLNRLDSKYFPTLGSDATSYYGAKIDDWSTNRLTSVELNDCSNKYNTRCAYNKGLPVGPIGNPSIESIEAVLNPEKHNYYYFVNDCKGKLYMSKNETEHNNIINKLKKENNWCA